MLNFEFYMVLVQIIFIFILFLLGMHFSKKNKLKNFLKTILLIWIITFGINYFCIKNNYIPIFCIRDFESTSIEVQKFFGLGYEIIVKYTFYNNNNKVETLTNCYIGPILLNSDNKVKKLENESIEKYIEINKNLI